MPIYENQLKPLPTVPETDYTFPQHRRPTSLNGSVVKNSRSALKFETAEFSRLKILETDFYQAVFSDSTPIGDGCAKLFPIPSPIVKRASPDLEPDCLKTMTGSNLKWVQPSSANVTLGLADSLSLW